MTSAASAPSVSQAAEVFSADLTRTVDRLRSMGLARLSASFEPEPTRADAAFALIEHLAVRAAELEGVDVRPVPRLADSALGDQCAVIGRDLLISARAQGDVAALEDAAEKLRELRRRI
jgi:hypothetical protein